MRDLSGIVEQLRNIRLAERKFLGLWAVEQTVILPALDRVAADIKEAACVSSSWNSMGPASRDANSPLDD